MPAHARARPYAVDLDWKEAPGIPPGIDGLLGMQLLTDYDHVHLDMKTPSLYLQRG